MDVGLSSKLKFVLGRFGQFFKLYPVKIWDFGEKPQKATRRTGV